MPGRRAVVGLGGTLIDHRHVHQPPAAGALGATVRLAAPPTGAQRPAAARGAAHPAPGGRPPGRSSRAPDAAPAVGELLAQRLADLLRTPPLPQPLGHELAQHRIVDQLAPAGPGPPVGGQPLRSERPILPAARVPVAAQFSTDRRRAAVHLGRDRPHRVPAPMQIRDHDPLVLGQVPREISEICARV